MPKADTVSLRIGARMHKSLPFVKLAASLDVRDTCEVCGSLKKSVTGPAVKEKDIIKCCFLVGGRRRCSFLSLHPLHQSCNSVCLHRTTLAQCHGQIKLCTLGQWLFRSRCVFFLVQLSCSNRQNQKCKSELVSCNIGRSHSFNHFSCPN